MSIPDRIILTLYTILMAIVAVVLIIMSLGIVPPDTLADFAATIPDSWEYAVGGVILLLVSIRLLIAGLGGIGSNTLTLGNDKDGKIHVSQSAMEDYVSEFSNDIFGVHNAKAVVKMVDNMLNVRVNASIEPGINIPDTTDEIKRSVKKNIMSVIGVEVKEVEVYFKHIKAKA
jgi:uncharacterized alkaline shock family protein YloU